MYVKCYIAGLMPPKEEMLFIMLKQFSSAEDKAMLGETGPFVVCI